MPRKQPRTARRRVYATSVLGHPGIESLKKISDMKVLVAIMHHLNEKSGKARPGIQRIIEMTKFSESTVRRSIREIKKAGIMDVELGGGRGQSNTYQFKNPVTQGDTLYERKPCQSEPETLSSGARNPVTQGDTRTTGLLGTARAAAANMPKLSAAQRAAADHLADVPGINQQQARRLAAEHDLDAAAVADLIERSVKKDAPAGWIIAAIRAGAGRAEPIEPTPEAVSDAIESGAVQLDGWPDGGPPKVTHNSTAGIRLRRGDRLIHTIPLNALRDVAAERRIVIPTPTNGKAVAAQ